MPKQAADAQTKLETFPYHMKKYSVKYSLFVNVKGSLTIRPFLPHGLKTFWSIVQLSHFYKPFHSLSKENIKVWGFGAIICLLRHFVELIYRDFILFSYTMLFPPVLHNFLLKHYLLPQFTLTFYRNLCNTGGDSII